jgi:hypothetical protein
MYYSELKKLDMKMDRPNFDDNKTIELKLKT